MDPLLTLIILFLVGTTLFSFIATIYRFFISLVVNSSPPRSNQRQGSQRSDLKNRESVSLKDAFYANEATRQSSRKNSAVDPSQKRNQQTRSNQLSSRAQQDAARRRAENLQQNLKRQPENDRYSSASYKNAPRQEATQTQLRGKDLTTLVPIEKVTSTKQVAKQSKTKKNQFQRDFVKGMIYKQILDEPRSLRKNK
ncbi:hypothetical protein SAMN05878443_2084 [Carnobacterium alterfunditum]|uniref:Uncharacterized protein n=1 Tax=Carnobacterium alterfunditum TaxID=28230 RepID=A0A1N6HUD7_9LACT|nr:hypothetical protein [Carnobacterium alterfunditum]SIO23356.1 hypothetical protein SAMN05878443_2084 [Carnobacterium alterfunditum]